MKVYALFVVFQGEERLITVFSTRETAVDFAATCLMASWHIQEVRYSETLVAQ